MKNKEGRFTTLLGGLEFEKKFKESLTKEVNRESFYNKAEQTLDDKRKNIVMAERKETFVNSLGGLGSFLLFQTLSNNTDISSLKALGMTLALVSVGVVLKSVFSHDYNAGDFYKEKSYEAKGKALLTSKNITDVNQAINNYTEVRKLWNNGKMERNEKNEHIVSEKAHKALRAMYKFIEIVNDPKTQMLEDETKSYVEMKIPEKENLMTKLKNRISSNSNMEENKVIQRNKI